MSEGEAQRRNHQMGSTQGAIEPNYSLTHAQHSQDN